MAWEITPQGYIKTTAKITKGAVLKYYGHEIGLTDNRANKLVDVTRSLDELSKPETLASFEGMPITITHPADKSVDANSWGDKSVGHIQNIRVEGIYIVCDVYIQDSAAIELLKDEDIREVSVGWEPADIQELGGKFYHINIRANHVAIVVEGRAGSDCRLNDNKGKPLMKLKAKRKSLVDAIKKLLTDSDLSADEINKKIDELVAELEEVQGKDDEESKTKAEGLQKQIDDLKDQLAKLTDEDVPAGGDDEKDAQIASLTAELEQVKKERDDALARVAELEAEKDKDSVMNDAKTRFPKVNLNDAKSSRDVLTKVLVDSGIYKSDAAEKLTDTELRAAYAGLVATKASKNTTVTSLLNDNKAANAKSASARLGGK
ncbi:MAG: hypothetical protein [Caudoviricetes sp.]|nr:MAG: hypothetical protein [Caudoviricetes sp.]